MRDLKEIDILQNEDTQANRFLTFLIGQETYGIEIRFVTEIIGMQKITGMPQMPDYIKGIINLRGRIIPLVDVRLRFHKQAREYDDRTCVVVINFSDIPVGLIVDSVSEVLTISEGEIAPLPSLHSELDNGYVHQIGKVGGTVVLLLDCERLLSEGELGAMDTAALASAV